MELYSFYFFIFLFFCFYFIFQYFQTADGIDAKKRLPFFRLWCIVELAAACSFDVSVLVKGGRVKQAKGMIDTHVYDTYNVSTMLDNLANEIEVESSECAVQADYDREMKYIKEEVGLQEVQEMVVTAVVAGMAAADATLLAVDAAVCGEKEALLLVHADYETALSALNTASAGGRLGVIESILNGPQGDHLRSDMISGQAYYPMWTACLSGNADVVRTFINIGANPNSAKPGNEVTCLQNAARHGTLEIVNVLLEKGADPMLCDHNGENSLVVACRRGHAGIVSSIMKAIQATNTKVDYKGVESRFVVALEHQYKVQKQSLFTDVMTVLNEYEIKENLFTAAITGNVKVLQTLLDQGGNINEKASEEFTRLVAGEEEDNRFLHKSLDTNDTVLAAACLGNHIEAVQFLISKGADVNARNNELFTPIFKACVVGGIEIIKLLIANKAMVNDLVSSPKEDEDDHDEVGDLDCPLFVVAGLGNTKCLQTLLENGAKITQRGDHGATVLHLMATYNGQQYADATRVVCEHSDIKKIIDVRDDPAPDNEEDDQVGFDPCTFTHV